MREAFVIGALLDLGDCDPREVGAAVTVALCGHWEHDGPCRWPHNNAIDAEATPARFRTLCIADASEADAVADKIVDAIATGAGPSTGQSWRAVNIERLPVAEDDRELAERLRSGPRADAH